MARLHILRIKINQSAISKIEKGHRPVCETKVFGIGKLLIHDEKLI